MLNQGICQSTKFLVRLKREIAGQSPLALSQWLLLLIPFTLVISKRLNVLVILLYGASVVLQPELGKRCWQVLKTRWVWAFWLFYGFHALSMAWSTEVNVAQFALERKASLLFIPLFIALDRKIDLDILRHSMLSLILSCCISIWICLFLALCNYLETGIPSFFFYHAFSWPLDELNAIYFSFFAFSSLVFSHFLIRVGYRLLLNDWCQFVIIFTLSTGLILLSSRLFISLTLLFLLRLAILNYAQLVSKKLRFGWIIVLPLFIGGVSFFSQTRDRFNQLLDSQFSVLQQDQFQYDTPFNGLTIRLLFWRFAGEIVEGERAFVLGLGIGDAQAAMNQTIVKHNVYHGNPNLGDHGYLGYNFHNQFVETWVQLGIVGLLLWLLLLGLFIKKWDYKWSNPVIYFFLAVLTFSVIESILERQHGIVFFAFFLSIFQITSKYEVSPKPI
ncbi:MAG: O-antigen ligase family protein [Saprospiraceae bacterium]